MTSPASLLREWDLLQRSVEPLVVEIAPRRIPQAWSVGTAEDAVAVALAFHHASDDPDAADIRVFLSERGGGDRQVRFALADLRCLPSDRRRGLVREDRRWAPAPRLTRKVVLGRPTAAIDLVTLRVHTGPGAQPGPGRPVLPDLGPLRLGGHLLFVDEPPAALRPGSDFRRVGRSGRLYTKVAGAAPAPHDDAPPPGPAAITLADRQQQARMVESHLNLARSLAHRFAHHGEMSDDLEQVALLALVKAAGRYTDDHGSSFATYATASILGELKRHFRDKTWMLRVPRSLQETYLMVKGAREELGQRLGASPTIAQIAGHLRISEEAVLAAMEAGDSYWPVSLDAPRRDSEDGIGTEIPVVDTRFESTLDRRRLLETLPALDPREQHIVKRLYFDGWTQRRVAEEIGVSQMQVSRMMARTLQKLRRAFEGG